MSQVKVFEKEMAKWGQCLRDDAAQRATTFAQRHVARCAAGRFQTLVTEAESDVKKYDLIKEIKKDQKFHFSSKKFNGKTFGFMLKNSKSLRIPIPWKGQLGFFDVDLPKSKIKNKEIVSEIIDEEYRYQWIGRH